MKRAPFNIVSRRAQARCTPTMGAFCVAYSSCAGLWHAVESSKTVGGAVCEATKVFRKHGVDEPEASAEYLATKSFADVATRNEARVRKEVDETQHKEREKQMQMYISLCKQRHELKTPIQYLVGDWDFHYINLKVRPPVLIPRPETEQLVEEVLHSIKHTHSFTGVGKDSLRILDIGCGSGAITLSLLNALSNSSDNDDLSFSSLQVMAIDVSREAIELTLENSRRLKLDDDRLQVQHIHNLKQFVNSQPQLQHSFDIIVSNPPYILQQDLRSLQPEIALHEDMRALDGGADGLYVIHQILDIAPFLLKAECCSQLWMEVDSSHPTVLKSQRFEGLKFVRGIKDYYGNDRFVQWNVV